MSNGFKMYAVHLFASHDMEGNDRGGGGTGPGRNPVDAGVEIPQ